MHQNAYSTKLERKQDNTDGGRGISFLLREDDLFALALARLQLLSRMFAFVLGSAFDGRKLIALDLAGLLDHLGQVSVTLDSPDLRHVCVALYQRLVVLHRLPLSR